MPNNKSWRRRITIAKGKGKKADKLNNANWRENTVERRKNVDGPNDVDWRRAGAKKSVGKLTDTKNVDSLNNGSSRTQVGRETQT